jgi:hypothetical protein
MHEFMKQVRFFFFDNTTKNRFSRVAY